VSPDTSVRRRDTVLDVVGTPVDSIYHHALAWHRTIKMCDIDVPLWRVHQAIGLGGDRIVRPLNRRQLRSAGSTCSP
jgi:hypothetical protein